MTQDNRPICPECGQIMVKATEHNEEGDWGVRWLCDCIVSDDIAAHLDEERKELLNLMTKAEELYTAATETLPQFPPAQIRRVAAELVQRGGEYTACGRFLERALEIMAPDAPKPPEKEPLTFEQAYGSQTMPGR